MTLRAALLSLYLCLGGVSYGAGEKSRMPPLDDLINPAHAYSYPRPVGTCFEAQVALARLSISCGPIDGVCGPQTAAALRAFQQSADIASTGRLDTPTRARLILTAAPLREITLAPEELNGFQPVGKTWLEKSQQTSLAYENVLEMLAERCHAHPGLLRTLNPTIDWDQITPSTRLLIPEVQRTASLAKPHHLHIYLSDRILQVRDEQGGLISHFPVSIAHMAEKRPEGALRVSVVIPNPDFTFDPAVFTESQEGRHLGRKLVIPPGPNNPVGLAWIGLDRPGYGIHGTPTPEHVGRTGSHGCFRLANWDALTLLSVATVGLLVIVDP